MKAREIKKDVWWVGAIDWDRRLFDSLIPLPDGPSYNAYLIKGKEKIALIDSVDPTMTDVLLCHLERMERIDWIISLHAEQDHSGAIPEVLKKYEMAKVIASSQAKGILADLLHIPENKIIEVKDGDKLSLGDKTLQFLYTPWVYWPETMCVFLEEDKILFSCDFFGSHLATSDLYVTDEGRVIEAAKRYYAEITMPLGAHPAAILAASLLNILRPKVKFVSLVGSYGWSTKMVEQITNLISNIKAEILPPVLAKGLPRQADFKALDELAKAIAHKHEQLNLISTI